MLCKRSGPERTCTSTAAQDHSARIPNGVLEWLCSASATKRVHSAIAYMAAVFAACQSAHTGIDNYLDTSEDDPVKSCGTNVEQMREGRVPFRTYNSQPSWAFDAAL
jgi:hypothetical protein